MKVLLTGGTGVIGSMISRQLVDEGIRPVVLARRDDRGLLRDIDVEFTRGDVTDAGQVARIMKDFGIDTVIHAAALMPNESHADPIKGFDVNSMGTLNLLEASRKSGVGRFVYLSAKGVYSPAAGDFAHPTYQPMDESYPRDRQMGIYGSTKLCGEVMGFQYRRTFGLDFVALRFAMTYGPGKLMRHGPLAVHSRMVEGSMLGRPVRIPQGGDQKDDMIYTRDCARAVVRAVLVRDHASDVYNIGTGRGATIVEFAKAVERVLPEADIEIGPGLNYLGIDYDTYAVFDVSRAREELGFTAEFGFEEAVRDYVDTMRQLGLTPTHSE